MCILLLSNVPSVKRRREHRFVYQMLSLIKPSVFTTIEDCIAVKNIIARLVQIVHKEKIYGICNSGVSFAERFHARIQFFAVTWSYVFAHFYASFGKRRLRTVGQNARRRLPSIRRGVVRCGNFCRIFPHQANHERTNNRAFVVGLRCGRLAIKSKMYFCGKMFVFAYKKLRTKP